jgi:hypothetical protein
MFVTCDGVHARAARARGAAAGGAGGRARCALCETTLMTERVCVTLRLCYDVCVCVRAPPLREVFRGDYACGVRDLVRS